MDKTSRMISPGFIFTHLAMVLVFWLPAASAQQQCVPETTVLGRTSFQGGFRLSPDELGVIFNDVDLGIKVTPVAGGPIRSLWDPQTINEQTRGYSISPDNSQSVFLTGPDEFTVDGIYAVPFAGGAVTPLLTGLNLLSFVSLGFSRDSSVVLLIGELESANRRELFSIPIGGGTLTRLSDDLVDGGIVFDVRAMEDGSVLYIAIQDEADVVNLYRTPASGGEIQRFTTPNIAQLQVLRDKTSAIMRGRTGDLYQIDLLDGSLRALNPSNVGSRLFFEFDLSEDESTIVYLRDELESGTFELFSVGLNADRSVRLSELSDSGRVSFFRISPNSQQVVYLADADGSGILELYSVPIGGGPAVLLSGELTTSMEESPWSFRFSPDGNSVSFLADTENTGRAELFTVDATGGPLQPANSPLAEEARIVNDSFQYSTSGNELIFRLDPLGESDFQLFVSDLESQSSQRVHDPGENGQVDRFTKATSHNRIVFKASRRERIDTFPFVTQIHEVFSVVPSGCIDVSIESTDGQATELGNTGSVAIRLSAPIAQPVEVFFDISGSVDASDYQPLPESLTIPAGAIEVPLIIVPVEDQMDELDETLTITLNQVSGAEQLRLAPQPAANIVISGNIGDLFSDGFEEVQ